MRTLVIIGVVSIAGSLFVACGDDEGDGGVAGSGGTAGTGGNAGTGGAAGMGGTAGGGAGGTAGSAGTGGAAGTGGGGSESDAGDAGETGLLEVRVAVTDENQLSAFNILLDANTDFSAGSLTFRIRADAFGDSVGVVPFVNDGTGFTFLASSFRNLNSTNGFGTGDFVDVTYDLTSIPLPPDGPDAGPPVDGEFDKREVRVIGIQIGTGAGYVSSAASDAGADAGADDIVVFIDSITFNGVDGLSNFEFSADAQGFVLNTGFGYQNAEVIHRP